MLNIIASGIVVLVTHALLRKATELRKNGKASFLRPDSKSQVSVIYKDGQPVGIDTVVISHQTTPEATEKQIHAYWHRLIALNKLQ